MATMDRYTLPLQTVTEAAPRRAASPQGELFARLAQRQLPVMKWGVEDEALFQLPASPTLH
jgi:hypothetical protein